jgi:chemotaxis protein MotB
MRTTLAVCAVLFAGCVTQGTYDALQKDFDEQKALLQKRDAELGENGEKISKLEANLNELYKVKEALDADKSAAIDEKSRLQANIDAMKTAFSDLAKRKAEADARLGEFKSLLQRFKTLIDAGKLKVKIADGRMVVELASDILFSSGSANLSKDGKAAIAEVGELLAQIPDRKFQVEGHTDNVPSKTAAFPSNWELGSARAITVVKTMVNAGVPSERISASSFGDAKPAKPNDSLEGRAANRRIEIVVVPDLSSLPGFDELNRVAGQ